MGLEDALQLLGDSGVNGEKCSSFRVLKRPDKGLLSLAVPMDIYYDFELLGREEGEVQGQGEGQGEGEGQGQRQGQGVKEAYVGVFFKDVYKDPKPVRGRMKIGQKLTNYKTT